MTNDTLKFEGIDTDLKSSLLKYGLVVAYDKEYEKDQLPDKYYLCIYKVGPETFDTGYMSESWANNFILGNEWPVEGDIKSFLAFVNKTKDEWLSGSFITRLSDLINSWGYENIMGSTWGGTNGGITQDIVIEKYL